MSQLKETKVRPDMRIISEEFGDITEDVARELAALNQARLDEACLNADRRQKQIVAAVGKESRVMDQNSGLRLVAQIDEDVFNYWESREGREFWTPQGELNWMLKRHPELAVTPKRDNPMVGYVATPKVGVHGKRGRWAL